MNKLDIFKFDSVGVDDWHNVRSARLCLNRVQTGCIGVRWRAPRSLAQNSARTCEVLTELRATILRDFFSARVGLYLAASVNVSNRCQVNLHDVIYVYSNSDSDSKRWGTSFLKIFYLHTMEKFLIWCDFGFVKPLKMHKLADIFHLYQKCQILLKISSSYSNGFLLQVKNHMKQPV